MTYAELGQQYYELCNKAAGVLMPLFDNLDITQDWLADRVDEMVQMIYEEEPNPLDDDDIHDDERSER